MKAINKKFISFSALDMIVNNSSDFCIVYEGSYNFSNYELGLNKFSLDGSQDILANRIPFIYKDRELYLYFRKLSYMVCIYIFDVESKEFNTIEYVECF